MEVQRRCDFPALFARLRERNLLFRVNHVYSSLTGPREADFSVEVLNGQMRKASDAAAENFAACWGKATVAGSDAHTIGTPASEYTTLPATRSNREFLEGLRRGGGIACGQAGKCWKLAARVFEIARAPACERSWRGVLLTPPAARERAVPDFEAVAGLVIESGAAL